MKQKGTIFMEKAKKNAKSIGVCLGAFLLGFVIGMLPLNVYAQSGKGAVQGFYGLIVAIGEYVGWGLAGVGAFMFIMAKVQDDAPGQGRAISFAIGGIVMANLLKPALKAITGYSPASISESSGN